MGTNYEMSSKILILANRMNSATSGQQPHKGILLCISALFLLACMDCTIKYLAMRYNVPLVVAIRYIINFLLMIVVVAPKRSKQMIETKRTGLVIVRSLCLVCASLFLGLALQRMPLAETTAIIFLAPMLVVLVAGRLLGEQVGVLGWVAAIGGFAGVLLIVRPGSGLDLTGVACALGMVAALAGYQLLSRLLARTEQTIALLFYSTLAGVICFGLVLPWYWEGQAPPPWQVFLFISMGISGGLGHFLYTAAYRHASASLLAPITYLQLLFAVFLSWMVFDHVPDSITILGMFVVAACGVMIALKSRFPEQKISLRGLADTWSSFDILTKIKIFMRK